MLTDTQNKHFSERVYYASGVPMARSFGRDVQPYLYNGKEFIEAHGLNEYDSKARMYYAPVMRTTTMDPLAEKYYHISPYAWCANNPVAFVDPEGRDFYTPDGHRFNSVFWRETNEPTINIDGITYVNIGEDYTYTQDNITYSYHQNELQSIKYSTNTEFRQQTTGTSCKTTCEEMVRSTGCIPETGRFGEILMATHDANGVVNGPNAEIVLKQGLCRLEDYLTNGMPCIIGIDYKTEQKHNLSPKGDGMTDHFVTIVGLTYNMQTGATTYNFYDPGSVKGADINNIITFNGTYLTGLTAARLNPFKVTTIRKNK